MEPEITLVRLEKTAKKKAKGNVPISFQARFEMDKERDTRGCDEIVYRGGDSKRAPTGTELDALKRIGENAGRVDYRNLAHQMGCSSSYMNLICRSLGSADYIDYKASGKCVLTTKGREELQGRGWLGEADEEEEKDRTARREKEMLERLVQFMDDDGILDGKEEEGDWVLGRVRCSATRNPLGWDLLVVALERSQFISRWGWGDLLGMYRVQLDSHLNLIDYLRAGPGEVEHNPELKEFLRR
ncbi:MAG: hypothetical protein HQ578_08335 [Chloroflexi bacterium]|nr:hypothetical protein [Chloroflexota bacterium]